MEFGVHPSMMTVGSRERCSPLGGRPAEQIGAVIVKAVEQHQLGWGSRAEVSWFGSRRGGARSGGRRTTGRAEAYLSASPPVSDSRALLAKGIWPKHYVPATVAGVVYYAWVSVL